MPERIQQILNRILEWWKQFTTRQKALIISIAAVVVVAFSILGYVVSRPTMVTLITCDDTSEASSVKDLLDENSITYELSSDGLTFSVNQEDQANASILLGSNNIPSSGYSISDAVDGSFSTTESDKNKKYQAYLENKFATDLASISNVESATVTLSLPTDDGTIISKDEQAYASVILQLSGEMDEEKSAGIANYIATELGNDSTENIVIIDGQGNVLFSGGDETSTAGVASSNLTVQQKASSNVENAAKSVILATDVYDVVEASASLNMSFDKESVQDYNYYINDDQTEPYLDSETESTSESTSGNSGTPGTDTNDDDTTYVLEDGTVTSSTTSDVTKDYIPSEKITTTEKAVGTVDLTQSSIALTLKNYVVYDEDTLKANGSLDDITFDEFIEQNSAQTATEVDENFYNLVSSATGIDTGNITIVAYDVPMFQRSEGSGRDWTDYLQIALAVLIFAMLGFVVFRTMRPQQEEEVAEEVTVESLLEAQQEEQLEDIGFSEKSEARILIEKFVDENPEAVANLMRNWLNDDWG